MEGVKAMPGARKLSMRYKYTLDFLKAAYAS
jgi:hypothetical protein